MWRDDKGYSDSAPKQVSTVEYDAPLTWVIVTSEKHTKLTIYICVVCWIAWMVATAKAIKKQNHLRKVEGSLKAVKYGYGQ